MDQARQAGSAAVGALKSATSGALQPLERPAGSEGAAEASKAGGTNRVSALSGGDGGGAGATASGDAFKDEEHDWTEPVYATRIAIHPSPHQEMPVHSMPAGFAKRMVRAAGGRKGVRERGRRGAHLHLPKLCTLTTPCCVTGPLAVFFSFFMRALMPCGLSTLSMLSTLSTLLFENETMVLLWQVEDMMLLDVNPRWAHPLPACARQPRLRVLCAARFASCRRCRCRRPHALGVPSCLSCFDHTRLCAHPRSLNLSTFVNTWIEPEAEELMQKVGRCWTSNARQTYRPFLKR